MLVVVCQTHKTHKKQHITHSYQAAHCVSDRGIRCGGEPVCVIDDAIWRLFAPGFHCSPVAHFLPRRQPGKDIFYTGPVFHMGPNDKSGAQDTAAGLVMICFSDK